MLQRRNKLKDFLMSALFVFGATHAFAQETTEFQVNHGPYLQEVTAQGATFVFTTSLPSFSFIELKEEGGKDIKSYYHTEHGLRDANTVFHSVRAEGLKPGAVYNYRIRSKEMRDFQPYKVVFGDSITSQWYTFRTTDPTHEGGSLFVVSDVHNNSEQLDTLLNLCDYKTCDAFLYAGDMMNYIEDSETPFRAFIDKSVQRFASSIPFNMVRGNHETRGKLARSYPKLFPKSSGKIYGSCRMGDIMIVMLDCGEDKPDDTQVYAGLTDFDAYRTEQAKWLAQLVETEEFKTARYRIVISHYPMVDIFPEEELTHGINDLKAKMLPIMNKAHIDLMVSGHTHEFAFHEKNKAGNAFPVIVGSNRSATRLDLSDGKIRVKVVDTSGKVLLNTLL